MTRNRHGGSRRFMKLLAVTAVGALVVAGLVGRARGDDRDLLRTTTAVPYVFFMLDTSSSMNADIDGDPLPANGDDPRSKIYNAKSALYEVFSNATEFHYGFAFYNQDRTRVTAKHWLYRPAGSAVWTDGGLSFTYPNVSTDTWVLGPLFGSNTIGSCTNPLDLGDAIERQMLNRAAKRSGGSGSPTHLWIKSGGSMYRLSVDVPSALTDSSSNGSLTLTLTLRKLAVGKSCADPTLDAVGEPQSIAFDLVTDFLYHEDPTALKGGESGGLGTDEAFGGYWQRFDAFADFDCGAGSFTGKGWEGNYDSELRYTSVGLALPAYRDAETPLVPVPASDLSGVDRSDLDEYCVGDPCVNQKYNLHYLPTEVRGEGRPVDRGDLIPFDWASSNHSAFMKRLNPLHPFSPDFRAAAFFENTAGADGLLRLKDPSLQPLIAAGGSPLAKAINDFRCWYSEKRSGQCRNSRYPKSWEEVARSTIGNEAGCIQPYLIIVTDAENTCGGEAPAADVAAMRAQANVRTWVIAIAPEGSASGQVNAIPKVGKGELFYVQDRDGLVDKLNEIRGIIEEEARTFASAAVPTVQATVDDKIFVSNFVPLNDTAVWPGTVNAFLKPLPLDDDFRPDTTSERYLWDAGSVLLTQTAGLGDTSAHRRVYYTPLVRGDGGSPELAERIPQGELGEARSFLEVPPPPASASDPATVAEKDLWSGLGLSFTPGVLASESLARSDAASILSETLAVKTANVEGVGDVDYLLGDVFHSDPTIIGAPANIRFFASNFNGYRDFARQQENRRKVLLVGTNEGMLHAFDAGRAQIVDGDVKFTNGTGKELFAYVPRPMLGEVRERAQIDSHDWGLDGSVKVADVFVDPVFSGSPVPADREWRTIVVGGFRRGATGYYALDVTQPDPVDERLVGVPARSVFVPPSTVTTIPDCYDTTGSDDPLTCHDELKWPAVRWEFQDTRWRDDLQRYVALDEELTDTDGDGVLEFTGNGKPDLAKSWSIPNLGRILICEGSECLPSNDPDNPDDLVARHVAIFGGGLPDDPNDWGTEGSFLYIVDIETGEAIYKRQLVGSVPSEPAAVDTDNDGFLDRIYVGTTAGFMYRVDLVEFELDASGNRVQRPYPNLESVPIRDTTGSFGLARRIPRTVLDDGVAVPVWEPRPIFDTLAPTSETVAAPVRRPIFFRPSVLFVAELGQYALSFGTGDREDLWRFTNVEGRIYTVVDDSEPGDPPFDESVLRTVDLLDANLDVNDPTVVEKNFLLDRAPGSRGWVMTLDPKERMINDPFGLSGVSFFVSFTPRTATPRGECTREGDSRIFAVNTTNANGFLRDTEKNRVRFIERKAFATSPFTEPGQTKNPAVDASERTADDLELGTHLEEIMNELKSLFPANCKFGNYRIDVKTVMSDTGVVFIAPVPVCIIDKNWKEFDR